MASEFTTRAGIVPSETELPYSITTSDVEAYLQKKVDFVCKQVAAKNGTNDLNNGLNVRVYTTEAGRSFLPFVIILPMEALSTKREKKVAHMPAVFNTKEEDRSAAMIPELYRLFSSFSYNKDDEQAFFSDDWRRARHVNRETSPVLKSLRMPKVQSMENGHIQVVTFMIDPIRVFHDMLTMQGDNRNFRIDITGWQKIRTGEYRYDMKRCINKGKGKKFKDSLADELNRKMRGSR